VFSAGAGGEEQRRGASYPCPNLNAFSGAWHSFAWMSLWLGMIRADVLVVLAQRADVSVEYSMGFLS